MEGDLESQMEVECLGSDSDSKDSNSPEGVSDDDDSCDEEIITTMQQKVSKNPYVYDSHIELVSYLRKACDLDRLRQAREHMSLVFPLTPELWLDWLTDEEKVAVSLEEKENVILLFEKAIKDYTSVSIWLEYVQFMIGLMPEGDYIEKIRALFETALTSVGIHVLQGSLIWDAYREFEKCLLTSMMELLTEDSSEEESKKVKLQRSKVFNLFRRQLSVPLMYMDKTFKEFLDSHPDEKSSSIQHLYQKAKKKLDDIKPYEDSLFESESPHLEEYRQYIEYELKEGNPARVQSLYERALTENCLVPELWLEYTKYLDKVVKDAAVAIPVHGRSVRNCPWSLACWKNYVVALERYQQPHDTIKDVFEKSFNAGFTEGEEFRELWVTYLDYMRRRINPEEDNELLLQEVTRLFEKAMSYLMTYYKKSDPQCSILQYWAKFEAKYCKNVIRGREIWNDIMNHGHHGAAEMWINYANFERVFGDEKHYRRVLLKGLHSASDWPESIGNLLLTFEREEGTLETLEIALEKYDSQMKRVQEKRDRLQAKEAEASGMFAPKKRSEAKISRQSVKQKASKSSDRKAVNMDSEGFKIPHPPSEEPSRVPPLPSQLNKRPAEDDAAPDSSQKKQKVEESAEHGVIVKHDSIKDDRTVFCSNLAYNVKEEKIREMFSKIGDIEEVRLVKDFKGRSKGYCYVVFNTREIAKNALAKDRERLDGRPMFVSPCENKKMNPTQSKLKFNTGLEKNKLFIKNMPFTTTEEDLRNIFQEFGTLVEVRLVTYRNGHSKGLAYVEFSDESSASAALVKTDGMKIGEHVLSVAISNPPPRKAKAGSSSMPSLGSGTSSVGPRGRGRTQVTLLPRALQRRPTEQQNNPPKVPPKSLQNGSESQAATSSGSKKLDNEDFRQMLLKK